MSTNPKVEDDPDVRGGRAAVPAGVLRPLSMAASIAASAVAGTQAVASQPSDVDPLDASALAGPDLITSMIIASVCSFPSVVAACESAAGEVRLRLLGSDVEQVDYWINLLLRYEGLAVGVSSAFDVGLAQGRLPGADSASSGAAAFARDSAIQFLLRTSATAVPSEDSVGGNVPE